MIEYKTLTHFEADDFRRLNQGYTSSEKYFVKKSETIETTVLSLHLMTLEQPYIKRGITDETDIQRLPQVISQGLSLGAYDGNQIVGLALVEAQHWNRSLWVWQFEVQQAYRRQGIGRQLMESLAEKTRQAGLRIIVCETQNTNVPAINFYRKASFSVEGIDLSYYTNNDIDDFEVAIFMKRHIV
jgi:ribosomal protein S18 acetylase RimI-like enzyme